MSLAELLNAWLTPSAESKLWIRDQSVTHQQFCICHDLRPGKAGITAGNDQRAGLQRSDAVDTCFPAAINSHVADRSASCSDNRSPANVAAHSVRQLRPAKPGRAGSLLGKFPRSVPMKPRQPGYRINDYRKGLPFRSPVLLTPVFGPGMRSCDPHFVLTAQSRQFL